MYIIKKLTKALPLLVIAILVFANNTARSNSLDSLIQVRQNLVEEYNELISTPRTSTATDRKVFEKQRRIIAIDNFIINDQFISIVKDNEGIKAQFTELEDDYDNLMLFFYIAAGCAALLLILLIIFLGLLSSAKKKTHPLKNQIEEMLLLTDSYKNDILQLSEDLEMYKRRAREAEEERSNLQTQVDDFDRRGASSHIELIRLKSENSSLKEKISELESNTIVDSSQDLVSSKEEKIADLEKALAEKENDISSLKDEVENAKGIASVLEDENKKMQELEIALKNELEDLQKEYIHLKSLNADEEAAEEIDDNIKPQLSEMEQEIRNLKEENLSLKEMLKAAEQVQEDVAAESQNENVNQLDEKQDDTPGELTSVIQQQADEIMKYQGQIENLNEKNNSLEWDNNIMKEELAKLKAKIENLPKEEPEAKPIKTQSDESNVNMEVENLLQQNMELQNELNEFKKLLDEELENREILIKEFKEMESFYRAGIQEDVETYMEKVQKDKGEVNDSSDKISMEDYNNLKMKNEELQGRIESFDEMFKNEEQARIDLENELKELLEKFDMPGDEPLR